MAALKEWVLILFLTSFIGTLANMLSPENPNIKKYLKFACSVVAAAVMIIPIKGLFSGIPKEITSFETSSFGEDFGNSQGVSADFSGEWIVEKTLDALKNNIDNTIYKKYGINSKNIYINIKDGNKNIQNDTIIVDSINVEISKRDIKPEISEDTEEVNKLTAEMGNYISKLAGINVEVKMVE